MPRRIVAVLVVLAAVVAVSGWWWVHRPREATILYLPEGQPCRWPDSPLLITYQGMGHGTTIAGEHFSFVAYEIERPDGETESITESLEGRSVGPWQVERAEGEWGLGAPALPLLSRIKYWLVGDDPPPSAVELHLKRLPSAAPAP